MFSCSVTTTISDPRKAAAEIKVHRLKAVATLGEAAELRASDIQHVIDTADGPSMHRLVTQWHVPSQAGGR